MALTSGQFFKGPHAGTPSPLPEGSPPNDDQKESRPTTPTSDPSLASAAKDLLTTPGLLTQLAHGEWCPATPAEIVAALTLVAQELSLSKRSPSPCGSYLRIAWQEDPIPVPYRS
jgi:hypothetical protein